MPSIFSTVLTLFLCLFISIAQGASSLSVQSKDKGSEWKFIVAPYGWLGALSTDVTVRGINDSFFIPATRILKHLDFVGELHAEASRGPWTFVLDPTYVKLSFNKTVGPFFVGPLNQLVIGPISENITTQEFLLDTGVYYRLLQKDINSHPTSLELLGGARYLNLKNVITLTPNLTQFFPGITVSSNTSVIAPIVGFRLKQEIGKARLWLAVDGGGFDVDNLKSTYQAVAGASYYVKDYMALAFAYRVLNMKINQSDTVNFNMSMYGPEAGIIFAF